MSGKIKTMVGLGVFLSSVPDAPYFTLTTQDEKIVRLFANAILHELYIIKPVNIQWIENC